MMHTEDYSIDRVIEFEQTVQHLDTAFLESRRPEEKAQIISMVRREGSDYIHGEKRRLRLYPW